MCAASHCPLSIRVEGNGGEDGRRAPFRAPVRAIALAFLLSGAALTPALAQAPSASPSSSPSARPLTLDEERAVKPKDGFKECDACPDMVVVPAGKFIVGSPSAEDLRLRSEGPQRAVTIAAPFAVGRFAVTLDDWNACVADGGCRNPPELRRASGKTPVVDVTFDDAKAYAAWLSKKTGKPYRLLSETEREYVTRAGTTTPFWWGVSISPDQANYDATHTYGGGRRGEWRKRPIEVDQFAPNPWGLYQVHGNVWEWTEDCWNFDNRDGPVDGSARLSGDCSGRVVRGGSWKVNPRYLRAASRGGSKVDGRFDDIGLRVARSLSR